MLFKIKSVATVLYLSVHRSAKDAFCLHLNAHTPLQVVCGYLLGTLCTFIPNLIIYHA